MLENEEIREGLKEMVREFLEPIIKDVIISAMPNSAPAVPAPPRYYTIREVCQMCNISEATLHNWAKAGCVQKIKDGKTVRMRAEDIDAAIACGDLGRYKHRRKYYER